MPSLLRVPWAYPQDTSVEPDEREGNKMRYINVMADDPTLPARSTLTIAEHPPVTRSVITVRPPRVAHLVWRS